MSVLILSILVQVALIIHVVKTGRNQIWIWVLALLVEHDAAPVHAADVTG